MTYFDISFNHFEASCSHFGSHSLVPKGQDGEADCQDGLQRAARAEVHLERRRDGPLARLLCQGRASRECAGRVNVGQDHGRKGYRAGRHRVHLKDFGRGGRQAS